MKYLPRKSEKKQLSYEADVIQERQLSFVERMMFVSAIRYKGSYNVLRGVKLTSSKLIPTHVEKALSILQLQQPLLQARVVQRDNNYYFQIKKDIPRIPIIVARSNNLTEVMEQYIYEKPSKLTDSLLTIYYVQSINQPEKIALLFYFSHSIMDGSSAVHFMHQVLDMSSRIMNNEEIESVTRDTQIPKTYNEIVSQNMKWKDRLLFIKDMAEEVYSGIFNKANTSLYLKKCLMESRMTMRRTYILDEKKAQTLLAFCRSKGLTVNALLAAIIELVTAKTINKFTDQTSEQISLKGLYTTRLSNTGVEASNDKLSQKVGNCNCFIRVPIHVFKQDEESTIINWMITEARRIKTVEPQVILKGTRLGYYVPESVSENTIFLKDESIVNTIFGNWQLSNVGIMKMNRIYGNNRDILVDQSFVDGGSSISMSGSFVTFVASLPRQEDIEAITTLTVVCVSPVISEDHFNHWFQEFIYWIERVST
jgi:hypothetical protein